jgi:hypothetical protein
VKSVLLKNKKYDRRYVAGWLRRFDDSLEGNYLESFRKIEKDFR